MPKPNTTVVAWMLNEIEADLKKLGFWSSEEMDPAIIQSAKAAFGMDVMPFTAWLQFVLLPNARRILATDQDWPQGSMVAVQATRELDGVEAEELLDHLRKFDALFNEPPDEYGFPKWMKR